MALANPWRRTRGRRLPSREQVLLLVTGAMIAAVGVALAGGELWGTWLSGTWLG